MTGELSDASIRDQAEAFMAYNAKKRGYRSIDEWMDTKDFHPRDREKIRKAYLRLLEAEVWGEETA